MKTMFNIINDNEPRSMKYAAVRKRRKAMLNQPNVKPLSEFAARLRKRISKRIGIKVEVPNFDPFDGGKNAKVLFLLEKPGPMTSVDGKRAGSGFVSRNNNDLTAKNTFEFMEKAGIQRTATVIWNTIPWWDGSIKFKRQDLKYGLECLDELLQLLQELRAVVLVGKTAQEAESHINKKYPKLKIIKSAHPSPIVKGRRRDLWEKIPCEWKKVARIAR